MNNAHHRRPSAVARCLRVLAQWSPADRIPVLARVPRRNAVLSVAGLAILGGAIAGPVAAVSGPSQATSQVVTQWPPDSGASIPRTAPLPSGTTPSLVKAVPAPFEKALLPDFQLQPNGYYCGPAATRIAISAHTTKVPSFDSIARLLGTTTAGTNSAMDTTRGLNKVLGAGLYTTRMIPGAATARQMDVLRTDMVHSISNGYAAVTNIVGGITDLSGGWHAYDGGHYVSVIGYGQGGNTMKIADPADTQGDGTYWVSTINLAKWMATRGYSTLA